MIICGIFGHAQSGKGVAADLIDREFGFVQVAFAEALKEVCSILYSLPLDMFEGANKYKKLESGISIREILQQTGTKVREMDKDIWVKNAFRRGYARFKKSNIEAITNQIPEAQVRGILFSDMRYLNELEAVKQARGYLIKIIRPEVEDGGEEWRKHASETELDSYTKWDYTIENKGTVEEYHNAIRKVMFAIIKEHEVGKA